jgi:hypothetical protein
MSQLANIKNEKQASKYIDDSIEMIIADNITKNDSLLLLKSVYCIPLIGNVSKEFVDYKVEMSRSKLMIKKKLTGIENEKIVRDILDDGEMIDYVAFVSETTHFENYILDDAYNSNIFGSIYAFEVLNTHLGKKYLITPGFVEMDMIKEELVNQYGKEISQTVDCVILVKNDFTILLEKSIKDKEVIFVESFKDGFNLFLRIKEKESILLIENDLLN